MRSLTPRRAFSTVELMLALVMGGLVAAAIGGVLRRQQRFFTNASILVEQRVALRDVTGILPGELRALASASDDVIAFSDSALDVRATIGAGIICDTVPGRTGLALAPSPPDRGAVLSSFATAPQAGDVALVYDVRASERASDDDWAALDVADVSSSPTMCAASPFVDGRTTTVPRVVLRFAGGTVLPPSVGPGAFVRLLRRVRYRFYRAGTGDWYLGYAEWNGSAFGVVQPVSGPFAPYSRSGASGLSLRYFDASGAELFGTGDATRIVRVDVVARSAPRESLASRFVQVGDSQSISVRLRNR